MERRFKPVSCEVRAADDQKPLTISGYAAVFFDASNQGTQYMLSDDISERIAHGAFDRALREGQDVVGLFNHDSDHVLGRTSSKTMTLSVDQKGLRYDIAMPNTQTARDLAESLQRGDINGSSFSFMVTKQTWTEDQTNGMTIREIQDVDLIDVGPVTFPAYDSTESECCSRAEDRLAALKEAQEYRSKQRDQVRREAIVTLLDRMAAELE